MGREIPEVYVKTTSRKGEPTMSLTSQEYAEIITILDEYRQQHPERYMFVSQWMCELNTMRLQVEKENLR